MYGELKNEKLYNKWSEKRDIAHKNELKRQTEEQARLLKKAESIRLGKASAILMGAMLLWIWFLNRPDAGWFGSLLFVGMISYGCVMLLSKVYDENTVYRQERALFTVLTIIGGGIASYVACGFISVDGFRDILRGLVIACTVFFSYIFYRVGTD